MKMLLVMAIALLSSAAFACNDGDAQRWPSQADNISSAGGEAAAPDATWVCKDGQYVEVGATKTAPKFLGCKEGQIELFADDSGSFANQENVPNVPYICQNGKFVNQYYTAAKRHAKAGRCAEGFVQQISTGGESVETVTQTFVCKNGSMKLVRTTRY